VDDERDTREALREVVEMSGCSAIVAENGLQALKFLEEHRPCLIILDLFMPVMTGHEMLREMQRQPGLAAIPVVIATSAPSRAPPGVPVLLKPVDISSLFGWIARTCRCHDGGPETS